MIWDRRRYPIPAAPHVRGKTYYPPRPQRRNGPRRAGARSVSERVVREAREIQERTKEVKELVKKIYSIIGIATIEAEVNGWRAGVTSNSMYAQKLEGGQRRLFHAYFGSDGEIYLTIENTTVIEALNIILEAVRRVL